MHKIKTISLVFLVVLAFVIAIIPIPLPVVSAVDGWTLINDARGVKAYSDLKEYVWQKNASLAPNGPYDKIGLHRLVKTGIVPKGVVFVNPGTYCSGEQLISNPTSNSFATTENDSQPYYWANRGFDVYAIDYRTHFVPSSLNLSQLGFMANWGHDQFISDVREAVLKTKEVSGASKIFMAGQSFGARITIYYATKYWREDLRGIMLLDGGAAKNPTPTNSYNLTVNLDQNNVAATWASIAPSLPGFSVSTTFQSLMQFAMTFPSAPANVPGTNQSLTPPLNPLTNRTWTNITEWTAFVMNGTFSNTLGGYGNIALLIRYIATMDRYWPDRLNLEYNAINDWTNCPYVTFDFDEYYKDVNVPLIGFISELYGIPRFRSIVDNIANPDVTKTTLLNYGHADVFMGIYSARDVSQPALDWLNRPLAASASSSAASVQAGQPVTFSASVTGGPGPYTYQWFESTAALAGQAGSQLTITKTAPGTYTYYCQVTDSIGMATNSTIRTLAVTAAPTPTPTPTPVPTAVPTSAPTATPKPTQAPTTTLSPIPTALPTALPTATAQPSSTPSGGRPALTPEATYAIVAAVIVAILIATIALSFKKWQNNPKKTPK